MRTRPVAFPFTESAVLWVAARSIRTRYVQSTSQTSEIGNVLGSVVGLPLGNQRTPTRGVTWSPGQAMVLRRTASAALRTADRLDFGVPSA